MQSSLTFQRDERRTLRITGFHIFLLLLLKFTHKNDALIEFQSQNDLATKHASRYSGDISCEKCDCFEQIEKN